MSDAKDAPRGKRRMVETRSCAAHNWEAEPVPHDQRSRGNARGEQRRTCGDSVCFVQDMAIANTLREMGLVAPRETDESTTIRDLRPRQSVSAAAAISPFLYGEGVTKHGRPCCWEQRKGRGH